MANLTARAVQIVEYSDGIILKRGCTELRIEGTNAMPAIQIILAGARIGLSKTEICELFGPTDRDSVAGIVDGLVKRHILFLEPTPRSEPRQAETPLDVFYWHFGKQPEQIAERLANTRFAVIGVNHISCQLATALAKCGVKKITVVDYPLLRNLQLFDGKSTCDSLRCSIEPVAYDHWASALEQGMVDCLVATTDFGGQQLMREWNEVCVRKGIPFFSIVLQDLIGYIGPLVIPGDTACYECVRARQNSNMDDAALNRASEYKAFEGQGIVAAHPSMASVLGDLGAIELTKHFTGVAGYATSAYAELNFLAGQMKVRKVLKVPRCAVCSTLNATSSIAIRKNVFMPGNQS